MTLKTSLEIERTSLFEKSKYMFPAFEKCFICEKTYEKVTYQWSKVYSLHCRNNDHYHYFNVDSLNDEVVCVFLELMEYKNKITIKIHENKVIVGHENIHYPYNWKIFLEFDFPNFTPKDYQKVIKRVKKLLCLY